MVKLFQSKLSDDRAVRSYRKNSYELSGKNGGGNIRVVWGG
jgi:hypothetical protein